MKSLEKNEDGYIKIEIKELIDWDGLYGDGCLATDKITKEGFKVGYMVREKPTESTDSGWRFMAGNEDDKYINDPKNLHLFKVNTICNFDPDIIPYVKSEIGSSYIRVDSKNFEIDDNTKPVFIEMQDR